MMETKLLLTACKTTFLAILSLFLFILARGAWGKCSDRTSSSTCLCIDDSQCNSTIINFSQKCGCLNGQDVTLEQLVEHLIQTNGVVEYLYLSGNDLYSLEPLDGHLNEVRHDLLVVKTALQSFKPLVGIKTIGNATIAQNTVLRSVSGFNVPMIGTLHIEDNPTLLDVDGLGNVTQVGGDLQIWNNAALLNVDGLGNVTQVGGYLEIWNNAALLNVDGLGNITQVGGD